LKQEKQMKRKFCTLSALFLCASSLLRGAETAPAAALPIPTPQQAAWQDDELTMFFHFTT
jgi:hypothetical protein